MKNHSLLLVLLILCMDTVSQNETRWWFFGSRAGLHFQTNTVVPVPGLSPIVATEATAVVADSTGNLLFYVNGNQVIYNRLHDTMPNGIYSGHPGHQACLIIRKSGSQYYVIHNKWNNYFQPGIPAMLAYSIVDMNLAAGLGSVTVKNQPVSPTGVPIVEMMAATKHCNLQDH